jgi:hypothetical protein
LAFWPKTVLVPVLRYLVGKCCESDRHISNLAEPEYLPDLDLNLEIDLLICWAQSVTDQADILNFRTVIDDGDVGLPDLQINRELVWSGVDPIHGSDGLHKAMATALTGMLTSPDPASKDGVPLKRVRLESVNSGAKS